MNKIKNILKTIQSKNMDNYPLETLKKMEEQLQIKQNKLVAMSEEILKNIEEKLNNHDGYAVNDLKKKFKKINNEYEENEEELKKLFNLQQKKILYDRLVNKLGSKKLVAIKEGFIMTLILLVLGLLYYDLTYTTTIETKTMIFWIDFGCCMIFLSNFYFEYRLTDSKKWYWKTHIIDFITSIPLPDAEILRLGRTVRLARLTRLLRLVRILRVFRFLLFFSRGLNELTEIFNVKLMKKSFKYGVIFLLVGAFIINYFEGHLSTSVGTMINSIWWSFTTVVTGGYADLYNPVSGVGRVLTVILIIAGMVLVGIFTATLTSILIEEDQEEDLKNLKQELNNRLDKIEEKLK